jgi:dihydropteroate synthase
MFTLNCKGKLLVGDKPLVMGVINITPDSFFEGSRFTGEKEILQQAEKMLQDGADILDIGGQSSRPASEAVTEKEEAERVIPAIEALQKHFPGALLSIDTWHSTIAQRAVEAGASIVNDISAGNMDPKMLKTVAALGVPFICMHMKGIPFTMQETPSYENITLEVLDFLIQKVAECKNAGIIDIIIDPGFGFGKTIRHNFKLLHDLPVFRMLGLPLMLGISRKSTIYKTLKTDAEGALNGTTVLNTIGLMNGADILRVHDVKEAKEAITLIMEYKKVCGL